MPEAAALQISQRKSQEQGPRTVFREHAIGSDWTVSSIVDSNFQADYSWTNHWGNCVNVVTGCCYSGCLEYWRYSFARQWMCPETAFNGTGALVCAGASCIAAVKA